MNQKLNITVNKKLFTWARMRAGLDIDELLKPFPKFAEWEEGVSSPTLNQLENLARKMCAPLGYFFLSNPPEEKLPIPDFRSKDDGGVRHPSPNLLETVFTMQQRQAWFRDFIIEEGAEPLPFVGSATVRHKPENVAAAIRKTLGITRAWAASVAGWEDALRELNLKLEQIGILTVWNSGVGHNMHRKLDVDEFRGFVLSDIYAPLIFVNNADARAARMFTLAHELAHIWINSAGILNFRQLQPADNETERFCNEVAAEFLIPKDELAEAWPNVKNREMPFDALGSQFKVSSLVAARRALDAGYIKKSDFFDFYAICMARYRKEKEIQRESKEPHGTFYQNCDKRIGRPFAEAILRATREGKLLYRDAYKLTGLQAATFDKYLQKLNKETG